MHQPICATRLACGYRARRLEPSQLSCHSCCTVTTDGRFDSTVSTIWQLATLECLASATCNWQLSLKQAAAASPGDGAPGAGSLPDMPHTMRPPGGTH